MSKYALLPYHRPNEMMNFWSDLDHDFFAPFNTCASVFQTDISDEGDHYLMSAELPGFNKEDIGIEMEGDQLVIRASHEEQKEDEKKHYVHRERSIGTYTRRFNVSGIDVEHINAQYENGVLNLTLPKEEKKAPEGRKISIL
ncbi:MAG: Hsp20/alpha crystallin family protein [Clostridia bacterium]